MDRDAIDAPRDDREDPGDAATWWQQWIPPALRDPDAPPAPHLESPDDDDAETLGDDDEEEGEVDADEAPQSIDDLRDWLRLMAWLVGDVFRHARGRAAALFGLTLVGVGARAATLATVVLYVEAQTSSKPPVILGTELPSDPTVDIALVWAATALAFALVAAGTMFVADSIVFRTARRYVESVMRELVRDMADGTLGRVAEGQTAPGSKTIMNLLHGSVIRVIRAITMVLGCLVPAVTLAVALGAMIWLSGVLSAVLVPVLLVYAVPLFLLNRMVLRDSVERETARVQARRDTSHLVTTLGQTRFPRKALPAWIREYPRRSASKANLDLYGRMILARKRVVNLRDAFEGLSLLTVLLVFGALVAGGGTASWGVFLSFILALRYATMSLGDISKNVTGVNRFLPQVQRFVAFRMGRRELLDEPLAAAPARARLPIRLEAPPPGVPGSEASVELGPGDVALCAYPHPVDSLTLPEFFGALTGGDATRALALEAQTFFTGRISPLPQRTIRELVSPKQAADPDFEKNLRAFLERCGLLEVYENELGGVDKPLSETTPKELRYVVRLLPGVLSKRRIFAIRWDTLVLVERELRMRVVAALSDRLVLLIAEGPWTIATPIATTTLIVGSQHVLGIGSRSWYEEAVKPVIERVGTDRWTIDP